MFILQNEKQCNRYKNDIWSNNLILKEKPQNKNNIKSVRIEQSILKTIITQYTI
jgi:hypothetical protein